MKPFTLSEYQKDPSKLSSRLKPNEALSTEHAVLFGDRLAVKEPGDYIAIYTEREAAEHFVLRTQYRELNVRPWYYLPSGRIYTHTPPANQNFPWKYVGPEQTILVED